MATKPKAKSKPPAKASGKARKPAPARAPARSGGKAGATHAKVRPTARGGTTTKPAKKPVKPAHPPVQPSKASKAPAAKTAKPAATVAGVKAAVAPGVKRVAEAKVASAPAAKGEARPAGAKAEVRPAARPGGSSRKSSRRGSLSLRRGSDGELFKPGDVLVPGGARTLEEIQYMFRGCAAAERPSPEAGINDVLAHLPVGDNPPRDPETLRAELQRHLDAAIARFEGSHIEAQLPSRAQVSRRGFPDVVERARARRREIGAFLRGLDLGRTETSHMDSHGEASLQSLMEWAARLENLADADEPDQADYAQFHRGLDQLENTTEALILDVEQTLRRLRDRTRAS